jgi:hypothetical protein
MIGYLIAIDPAKSVRTDTRTGIAKFVNGQLSSVALMADHHGMGQVLAAMAYGKEGWHVVIEKPQIYDRRQWKGDPNDLIEVAITAGFCSGVLQPYIEHVEYVTPQQWKGQQPKAVNHNQTLVRLAPEELEALNRCKARVSKKSKMHNVLDAVGIGLWKLGRR